MATAPAENKSLYENVVQLFKNVHSVLRTSAFTDASYKAAIYWLIVVIGSLIHEFYPPPRSYLSYTKNVFNVYFVKFGWGWTWMLLSLLVVMTSAVLTSGDVVLILRHYSRLLVAAIAWFSWVNVFEYVEHLSGTCKGDSSYESKITCRRNGYFWKGFDVSGHVFLLIHCSLTISEEMTVMKKIEILEMQNHQNQQASTPPMRFKSKYLYNLLKPIIKVTFLCTAMLMFLWEVMLVCTCVYFHTAMQKILGSVAALTTWWFTYRYWYNSNSGIILTNR